MLALKHLPVTERSSKAKEYARRSVANRTPHEDPHTLHKRALDDARGLILRHGITYTHTSLQGTPWAIIRSKNGRTNQVDLHVGNSLVTTCSLRALERGMKRQKLQSCHC